MQVGDYKYTCINASRYIFKKILSQYFQRDNIDSEKVVVRGRGRGRARDLAKSCVWNVIKIT